jgi:hypothetical protein
MPIAMFVGEVGVVGRKSECSTVRHRVAGVDGEIEQHLLELPRIGVDESEIRIEMRRERDVLADEAAQQLSDVGHHRVDVDCLQLVPASC